MKREKLTILGSGDPMPDDGHAVMIIDGQTYAKSIFESLACRVEAGDSVLEESSCFRLNTTALSALEKIDFVDAHVLFFATDDTHANTFLRIAAYCNRSTFVVHKTLDLKSRAALEAQATPYTVHERNLPEFDSANIAVVGNDNGFEERLFIHRCRQKSIPVISLQEAVNLEFNGSRMSWADRTFVGGTHALRYHERTFCVLTGNPRYDDIRPELLPDNPYILINCNFTFGIASDWGRLWLEQAIEAARNSGVDYRITVHPRDQTDLSGVGNVMDSGAFLVHEQITGSYVLVSRDSSLPYEAILMNRHAVYFNPFHETEHCLNEDDTGLIQKCETVSELSSILKTLQRTPLPQDGASPSSEMFRHYYTGIDGKNHLRVVRALQVFLENDYLVRPDAQADSYLIALVKVWLQNVARPKLRKMRWVRGIWQFFKYRIFRYERI